MKDQTNKWCAGFLPKQGVTAQGIGWEVEKAPTIRCFDTGGVLVKVNELPRDNGTTDGE